MTDGPAYTVLDARPMIDGRIRVLVRKRGGRLIRFECSARAADGITITQAIETLAASWPDKPSRQLLGSTDG